MNIQLKTLDKDLEDHNAKVLKLKRWSIFKEKRAAVIDMYIKVKKTMFFAK